ncbi:zinc finger MYM-type protein 1-like [Quercus lobata]|uniref:zinc finger MYM-type protein 1-like n=1 Tax=Quercus lobata TaxID=97700 RepID=UPI001246CC28|nr:zinc finger MYM-type protein 1-like [Quercus lobata]
MQGDEMGSPWIADASTTKLLEMVHRSREESGVVGNHVHEATNLVDSNPTREVVGIDPSTPRTEVLLENGKVQKLVGKVGEMEATLGVFGGEQIVDQGDLIEGMQWEIATYQDLKEVPELNLEILHILANNVRNAIREEIGDAKFCILVDEARDESKREQMAIILRFVDKEGFIKEHFFHVVHVRDTTALTLKNEICAVLSRYNLHIENIRGQGYDGASNMRGEWNGLQALFLKDCPYAYYVHCMAHRLQLALVKASREVKDVHQFFDHLVNIINIVVGSSKCNDELQHAQAEQVENMIASNEIETGRGANQIGTLQRAGDTRWGSYFQSICSLIKMFDATCKVINTIFEEGANYKQRGDAEGAYQVLTSFEFILILHLMKEIMGITNVLCQDLQQQSQDLLNAMHLVSTTKSFIQKLRDDGWEPLLATVISFCEQHEIDIPDMNARYTKGRGRYRRQDDDLTMEHHFRIGIFTVTIDFQLQELKSRFCELTTKLVILSSALNPKDAFRLFKIVDICNLVKKYYPQDFTEHEQELLESQLRHYELDVIKHPDFQNMSTISELCRGLKISGKSKIYFLIDRFIRLVLTLPVSTATTERAFSAMKLLKTRLRNRMEDEFLADNMIIYIEKKIAGNFTIEMIMDEFYSMKNHHQA